MLLDFAWVCIQSMELSKIAYLGQQLLLPQLFVPLPHSGLHLAEERPLYGALSSAAHALTLQPAVHLQRQLRPLCLSKAMILPLLVSSSARWEQPDPRSSLQQR